MNYYLLSDDEGRQDDWDDYVFDPKYLVSYNRSQDGIHTTISLTNGESGPIRIPFDNFQQFLDERKRIIPRNLARKATRLLRFWRVFRRGA